MIQEKKDEAVTLLDYWAVVVRRRKILIGAAATIFLATILVTFTQAPLYRASATLIVEPDTPELAGFTGATQLALTRDFLETQYAIIRSNRVLQKAFDASGLGKDPAFAGSSDPVSAFRSRVNVTPVIGSRLVRVSVDHGNRATAIRTADTLAQTYIDYSLEQRRSASRQAFEWLSREIEQARGKVETSEKALLEYQGEADQGSVERRRASIEERIGQLGQEFNQVANRNVELESTLKEIARLRDRPELVESLPALLESPVMQRLKSELADLTTELAKIAGKFKPKHPDIVGLESQIASVRSRLVSEVEKLGRSRQVELRMGRAKEEAIKANLDALKKESIEVAEQSIRYGVLRRESESNQQILDVLLKKLGEAGIGGSLGGGNIRILDSATAAPRPHKPRKMLNLVLGLISGLVAGTGLAFLVEHVDNSFKSERDVAQMLREPLLGLVPRERTSAKLIEEPSDPFRRAYEGLRTELSFHARDHILRTLVVTSAVRSEGKSVSAAALGLSLAASGQKVLLVDADLFGPTLSKLLGVRPEGGLSDHFGKGAPIDSLIVRTRETNLDLLPAGLIPPKPSEHFGSEPMRRLLESLRERYSLVIIDSPPLAASLEVAFLAAMADGVLFVVKAGATPRPLVRKSLTQLRSAKANVLGIVLTSAEVPNSGSSYYYDYPASEKGGGKG
jgi:capsular exopolysaccharide synthesis family protein